MSKRVKEKSWNSLSDSKKEERAFFELLCEKMPALNKNFIKEFMKVNKLFTMKDFLNKYNVLNQKTMNELHNDMLEFMFT